MTKYSDMYQKIDLMIPNSRAKNDMIMTLLGCGVRLCEYFKNKNLNSLNLTKHQIYCLEIISANLLAITQDYSDYVSYDISRLNLSEQNLERVFQVVKQLHKTIGEAIKQHESI